MKLPLAPTALSLSLVPLLLPARPANAHFLLRAGSPCDGLTPASCELLTAVFGLDRPTTPSPAPAPASTWPFVRRFSAVQVDQRPLAAAADDTTADATAGNPGATAEPAMQQASTPKYTAVVRPAHTIVEHEDRYLLSVDLPGVPDSAASALELEIRPARRDRGSSSRPAARELHLHATRRPEQWQAVEYESDWVLHEDVDEQKPLEAALRDGVLTLALPKKAPDDLRTPITVQPKPVGLEQPEPVAAAADQR